MKKLRAYWNLILTAFLLSSSCFSPVYAQDTQASSSVDTDIEDAQNLEAWQRDLWDPAEVVNRKIFWFNDQLDGYVLEPVARGYDYVTPEVVQTKVGNFFRNLGYPSYLVSDVVQLKLSDAALDTGRFLINSTIGVLGLFDVAQEWGLKHKEKDFGVALAYYNIPPGPYMVLPFYGPSNLRDTCGRVVDFFLDPFGALSFSNASSGTRAAVTIVGGGLRVIDRRARLLDALEDAKNGSLDYYLFLQSAYYQYRLGLIEGLDVGQEGIYHGPSMGKSSPSSDPNSLND